MSFDVRLTSAARRDIVRLESFLAASDRSSAKRAVRVLTEAIISLEEMPNRGRVATNNFRELFVPFGRYGYLVFIGSMRGLF